jgi:hypothetical protein
MNQIKSDSSGVYAVPLFDPFEPVDTLQRPDRRNYIDVDKAIVVIYYDTEFRLSPLDRKIIGQ